MKKVWLIQLVILALLFGASSSSAAGTKPVLRVNCGHLMTLNDNQGEFWYFNPTVSVTYWGKYLKYWIYQSPKPGLALADRSAVYGTETRSTGNASTFGTSNFDWSQQLRFEYFNTAYTEIYIVVKDSLKRTSTMTCIWKRSGN